MGDAVRPVWGGRWSAAAPADHLPSTPSIRGGGFTGHVAASLVSWIFLHFGMPRPDEVQAATGGATSVDVVAASGAPVANGTDADEEAAFAAELSVEDPDIEPRSR